MSITFLEIRHTHQSGRYSKPASVLFRNVLRLDKRADLLTYTELAEEKRARVLQRNKIASKFGSRRGKGFVNADDVAILWRKGKFEFVDSWSVKLTNIGESWRPRPPSAIFVVLRDLETGALVLVTEAHLPTQVESPHGWATHRYPMKVKQYHDCIETWVPAIHDAQKKHNVAATIVVADWNLSARLPWVRDYINQQFAPLRLTWNPTNLPSRGTHGMRVIDATVTDMHSSGIKVLSNDGSSDHNPYSEDLAKTV